jgi:hypothetical protein
LRDYLFILTFYSLKDKRQRFLFNFRYKYIKDTAFTLFCTQIKNDMKNLFYYLLVCSICCPLVAQNSDWKCLYNGLSLSNALNAEEKLWFSADKMGILSVQKDGTTTQLFMPGLTNIPAASTYQIYKDGSNSYILVSDYIHLWQFDGANISPIQLPTLPQGFFISSTGALKNGEGIGVGFYDYTTHALQVWNYYQGIWTNNTSNFGLNSQLILPDGVTWKQNSEFNLLKTQGGSTETFLVPDSIRVYKSFVITSLTPLKLLPDGSVLLQIGYFGTVGGCGSEIDFRFDRYLVFSPQTLKWSWVGLSASFFQNVVFGEDGKVFYQFEEYLTQIMGETESIIQLPDVLGINAKLLSADDQGQFWFSDIDNDLIRFAPNGVVQKFGHIHNADVPLKNNLKMVHTVPNSHRMWLSGDSLYLFDQTLSQKYLNKVINSLSFDENKDPLLHVLDVIPGTYQSNFYNLKDNQFLNTNIHGQYPIKIPNSPKIWFLYGSKIHRQTIGLSDEETLPNTQENFPDLDFVALESDKTGQIYALTYDNDLYKRNIYNQWISVNLPWYLKSYSNLKIMIDGKNRLNLRNSDTWYRLNGNNWEFVPLTTEVSTVFELNAITGFAIENDSISWASTLKGLYKINENQVELVHPLGINDVNFPDAIYSIAIDSSGTKWMTSSAFGLLAFHENGIVLSDNEVEKEPIVVANSLQIFPQPNEGIFQVKCTNSLKKPALWRVYSPTGQLVQEKNINSTQFETDLGDVSSGVYYYLLQTTEGVFSGKILVSK